jgi:hypothetical protein
MRIFLPRDTNRIAMAKQAFIAVHVFGDRFTNVVAAPRTGIKNCLLLTVDIQCESSKSC